MIGQSKQAADNICELINNDWEHVKSWIEKRKKKNLQCGFSSSFMRMIYFKNLNKFTI